MFACTSTLSKMGPGGTTPIISDFINVTYRDECEQPQLYPAIGSNDSLLLYESGLASFVSPYSTFQCGPVTSTLVFPPDHPANAPDFYVDPLRGSVVTFPTSWANLGQYPMRIESCVTIVSSGELRCVQSEEFVITIADPCPFTQLSPESISTVLSAPQLGYDSLTMQVSVANWPWRTNLDYVTSMQYEGGNLLCGQVDYAVFYNFNGNYEQPLNDFVALTQETLPSGETIDKIAFNPTLDNAPGTYDMVLCGRLQSYYPTV